MTRRILVPLDGTPLGEAVLPHVAEIARALGADIELLHVVPPRFVRGATTGPGRAPPAPLGAPAVLPAYSPSATVLGYRFDPAEVESNRRYVERVAEWLRGEGLRAEAVVLEGPDVAEAVIKRSRSADLLALSVGQVRPAAKLERFVYGSISARILQEVGTPVLLVRVPVAAG